MWSQFSISAMCETVANWAKMMLLPAMPQTGRLNILINMISSNPAQKLDGKASITHYRVNNSYVL